MAVVESFKEKLRISEDDSFLTRATLYEALWEGIKINYGIIPHGCNSANSYIKQITGDDAFSSHNDFLRYIFDWGMLFIVLLCIIIKNIHLKLKFTLSIYLIILPYLATGLHNLMFLPLVWIPFLLILNVIRYGENTRLIGTKVQ